MAQGLHLSQRLTQSLVLAPQLQQSLALLQAPTLELKALVEQELQQNPVLEEAATHDTEIEEKEIRENDETPDQPETQTDQAEPPEDIAGQEEGGVSKGEGEREPVDDFEAEFEKLVQLDQEWRDHFAQTNLPMRASAEDEEKRQFMFDTLVAGTTLADVLLEQVRESDLAEKHYSVAEMIIGNLDEYGYLKATIEELTSSTGVPGDLILQGPNVIQTFDPPGVGARDLRECLLLQFERAGETDTLPCRIVRDHMEALGKRRIPEIARATGHDVEEGQEAR